MVPLTAATNVAGLLSLAIQVSQILIDQIRTVENAPKDAQDLLDEFQLSFLYRNYKEKEVQITVNLVSSILQQLTQRQLDISSQLRLLYEQHSGRKTRPKLAECSKLLHIELTACSKAFIIVDALDKCDEISRARHDLINQLLGLPLNTYVMVASRELPSIEHELRRLCRLSVPVIQMSGPTSKGALNGNLD